MLSRSFAAAVILVWFQSAHALSIRFEFPGAMQGSSAVAWVEIEQVEPIVAPSGQICGSRYQAKVIDGIKGASTGDRIAFGYFTGKSVGSQYFVFLEETAQSSRNATNEELIPMTSYVPHIAECRSLLPRYIETAEGVGTIPVLPGEHVSNEPSVTFGDPLYGIPASLPDTYWHVGHVFDGQLFGSVEMSASNFGKYLRTLSGRP